MGAGNRRKSRVRRMLSRDRDVGRRFGYLQGTQVSRRKRRPVRRLAASGCRYPQTKRSVWVAPNVEKARLEGGKAERPGPGYLRALAGSRPTLPGTVFPAHTDRRHPAGVDTLSGKTAHSCGGLPGLERQPQRRIESRTPQSVSAGRPLLCHPSPPSWGLPRPPSTGEGAWRSPRWRGGSTRIFAPGSRQDEPGERLASCVVPPSLSRWRRNATKCRWRSAPTPARPRAGRQKRDHASKHCQ